MNDHQKLRALLDASTLKKEEKGRAWQIMKADGYSAAEVFVNGIERIQAEYRHRLTLRQSGLPYQVWGASGIESGAIDQMNAAMRLPVAIAGALMPDAHQGYGLPIGGVLATQGAVIPYAVGVDIGCRMMLSVFDVNPRVLHDNKQFFMDTLMRETIFGAFGDGMHDGKIEHAVLEDPRWNSTVLLRGLHNTAVHQIGTSGGGNHFVNFCSISLENDNPFGLKAGSYLALLSHSGSRGVGAKIADYYTALAQRECAGLDDSVSHLAWLKMNGAGAEYWEAMELAGAFASANHHVIHGNIARAMFIEPAGQAENHHNFCVPATEIVPTTNGPRTMDQLKPGDHVYAWQPGHGVVPSVVTKHWESGYKPIYTITTRHRRLRVSGDHPVLVQRDNNVLSWVSAQTVVLGDKLVCAENYYARSEFCQPGEARFIGAYLGDGWLRKHPERQGYSFGLAIGKAEELHTLRYRDLMLSLTLPEIEQRTHKYRNLILYVSRKGAFGITGSNKRFYHYIQSLGIGETSLDRRVPDRCFQMSRQDKLELLAGYFDADGSIGNKTRRDASGLVASPNCNLVQDLRELAIGAGLDCAPIRVENRKTNFNTITVYRFNISPHSMKELDLWHIAKQDAVKLGNTRLVKKLIEPDVFLEPVLSINIETEECVYDIEIDYPTHSFVCSGTIVHNCWKEDVVVDGQVVEALVHRKGATPAGKGVLGLIPGSMADPGYLVRGRGNPVSLNSASHGAGRAMSRRKAKENIDPNALRAYLKDNGVTLIGAGLDEAPQAYKRIAEVIAAQADLVEVIGEIVPVIVRMADDSRQSRKPVPADIVDTESD